MIILAIAVVIFFYVLAFALCKMSGRCSNLQQVEADRLWWKEHQSIS
jgi:hypothetical protein